MTNIPPTQAFLNKWDIGNLHGSSTKPTQDGVVQMGETGVNLEGLSKHQIFHEGDFVADLDKLVAETPLPEMKQFIDNHLDPYAITAYLYQKYPDLFKKWDENQSTQLSPGELRKHGGIDQFIKEFQDTVKNPAHAHMMTRARLVIRNKYFLFDRAGEARLRNAAAEMAKQNPAPTSTIAGIQPAAGQSVNTGNKK